MSVFDEVDIELEAALEQWDDHRVIHIDDLYTLLVFWKYVPSVLSQLGMRFHGYSLRQVDSGWMLVVKASELGTPLVAFLTSATTTGCIRLFVSQLKADRVKWNKDRYPWI